MRPPKPWVAFCAVAAAFCGIAGGMLSRRAELEARINALEARIRDLDNTVCEIDADVEFLGTMHGNRITRTQRMVAGPDVFWEAYSPEEIEAFRVRRSAEDLAREPWRTVPRRPQ